MRLKLIQQTLYYKYMQTRHHSNLGRSKYLANPAAKNEKVNFQVEEGIFVRELEAGDGSSELLIVVVVVILSADCKGVDVDGCGSEAALDTGSML